MDKIKPDWTSLPLDLLCSIAERLRTRINIIRFRSVCRSFRSAMPPPKLFSLSHSVFTATDFIIPSDGNSFVLCESTIYAIQPLNGISNTHDKTSLTWLVKVEPSSKPGILQLKNPLCPLIPIGEIATKLPKSLSLLDYRVMEVSKYYNALPIGKVVFSSSLDETDDGFAVMAKYYCKELIMWRNVDKKWSNIDMSDSDDIADIIYHNNKFYALLSTGRTVIVDSESLMVSQVAAGLGMNLDFLSYLFLVESFKDLFVLVREEFNVKVFRLDEDRREWVEVVSGLGLEDRVFFIGGGGSFSLPVRDFPECKGNCVYFWASHFDKRISSIYAVWVFHLEDGTVEKLSDSPGYFYVSWTTPTWFKQH